MSSLRCPGSQNTWTFRGKPDLLQAAVRPQMVGFCTQTWETALCLPSGHARSGLAFDGHIPQWCDCVILV